MMHDFIRYGYIYGIGVRVWVHTSGSGIFRFGEEVVEVVVVVEVAEVVVHPESE